MGEHAVSPEQIVEVLRGIVAAALERVEAATGGISTMVYRIMYPHETLYLRLLPDPRD
jgi:hypothetical protein